VRIGVSGTNIRTAQVNQCLGLFLSTHRKRRTHSDDKPHRRNTDDRAAPSGAVLLCQWSSQTVRFLVVGILRNIVWREADTGAGIWKGRAAKE
jgi:hypothetical protein